MKQLPHNTVRLGTPVASISPESARDQPWRLRFRSSSHLEEEECFDGVIVAARSTAAAKLLRSVDEALARRSSEITYAGTSIVVLAYRREQIGHRLDGFGFVVPLVEKRRILAASFSSVKFAERAPPKCELIRVFVGGACQAELAELPENDLYDLVENELRELLDVRGDALWRRVIRWPGAMPQYHVGHTARVEDIERHCRRLPQLELAGNAYHGVGVPFCIKSGIEAAERLTKALHL